MQDNTNESKELSVRNKPIFVIAILSVTVLLILIAITYKPPKYKEYSGDAFYVGQSGENVNPRELYERMSISSLIGTAGCRTEMTKADKATVCGRYTWIKNNEEIKSASDLNVYIYNGDSSMLRPYSNGDMIVAPAKLNFVNSNVNQESEDSIYIAATIYNKYLIRWDNVKTWWCHIGKDDPNKHSEIIGAKGSYALCTQGYIIGEATSDTIVSLYKFDDNGNPVPVAFSELFF